MDDENLVKTGKQHRGISQSESQATPELDAAPWEYIETEFAAYVFARPYKIDAHWDGTARTDEIRTLMKRIAAIPALYAALQKAAETIRIWHGEVGWEIYESHSP